MPRFSSASHHRAHINMYLNMVIKACGALADCLHPRFWREKCSDSQLFFSNITSCSVISQHSAQVLSSPLSYPVWKGSQRALMPPPHTQIPQHRGLHTCLPYRWPQNNRNVPCNKWLDFWRSARTCVPVCWSCFVRTSQTAACSGEFIWSISMIKGSCLAVLKHFVIYFKYLPMGLDNFFYVIVRS